MNLLSKQTDICVIDGICYEKGFVNPAQKNLACRPDYSTDSWTALRGTDLLYITIVWAKANSMTLLPGS